MVIVNVFVVLRSAIIWLQLLNGLSAVPPPELLCGRNQEFLECGTECPETCENLGTIMGCSDNCESGCFCIPGFVRNLFGECVRPSECFTDECGENERYNDCGSSCPETCSTLGREFLCPAVCVRGCFCRPGFVRNSNGICVRRFQCFGATTCKPDEVFRDCVPTCRNRCDNLSDRGPCRTPCQPGCYCRPGMVKNDRGICISPHDCPRTGVCKLDERFYECVPTCRHRCDVLFDPRPCPRSICTPGCYCPLGLVKNSEGTCVKPSDCPTVAACKPDERFYECVPNCRHRCNLLSDTRPCPRPNCTSGCYCTEDLVKNDRGACVKPSDCPRNCRRDEKFYRCKPTCRHTCESIRTNSPCLTICESGCFCLEGLVKDDFGNCIPPSACRRSGAEQLILCNQDEVFKECASDCGETCDTLHARCAPPACLRGCFCRNGLVRSEDGRCILPKDCPIKGGTEECGINEEYSKCVNPCNDCKLKGRCDIGKCVYGCDCKSGFFRHEDRGCIPADSCPKSCGMNEEYSTCVIPCNTCKDKGKCSIPECIYGCDCKTGFFRNELGACIPETQCTTTYCGLYEEYTTCINPCNNCEDRGNCKSDNCISGCDCQKGYFKNESLICVAENKCPPSRVCRADQQYYPCVPDCKNTCQNFFDPLVVCPKICKPGCFCKEGLVLNEYKKCVAPETCSRVPCKANEQFYQCAPMCEVCEAYDSTLQFGCNFACKPGCFCKPGLIRRSDGQCVNMEQCFPGRCKADEKFYKCIPQCRNTCENFGTTKPCQDICRPGCFCKENLVKRKDGKCVPPNECQTKIESCNQYETFYPCMPTCETCDVYQGRPGSSDCDKGCKPGCHCKLGYVKTRDGRCVLPDNCPVLCGPDEKFYNCVPSCGTTCDELLFPPVGCIPFCRAGCFCKDGLVRNQDGKCVLPNQCQNVCRRDEKFYSCKPTCQHTCESIRTNSPCLTICESGCFCLEGLVKDDFGNCIPPSACRRNRCPSEEVFLECGTACELTCRNFNLNLPCTLQCVRGCFCKDGFVRNDTGKCIPSGQCPKVQCGRNEIFYPCMPLCETCNVYQGEPESSDCNKGCKPGCHCKLGYVKTPQGECVLPENCPVTCGPDKQFYTCIPFCRRSCDAFTFPPVECFPLCRPGCFCKDGLFERRDGKCVPPDQCPSNICKPNSEFFECGTACPVTCQNPIPPLPCTRECVRGCACKDGFVLNDTKDCVRPEECPRTDICGMDETFYECIPDCRNTCENFIKPEVVCDTTCRSGCYCREGFVKRRSDGKCVLPFQCRNTCPPNEQYYTCIPDCRNTCENFERNDIPCPRECNPGCYCRRGLIKRESDGLCVPPISCSNPPVVFPVPPVLGDEITNSRIIQSSDANNITSNENKARQRNTGDQRIPPKPLTNNVNLPDVFEKGSSTIGKISGFTVSSSTAATTPTTERVPNDEHSVVDTTEIAEVQNTNPESPTPILGESSFFVTEKSSTETPFESVTGPQSNRNESVELEEITLDVFTFSELLKWLSQEEQNTTSTVNGSNTETTVMTTTFSSSDLETSGITKSKTASSERELPLISPTESQVLVTLEVKDLDADIERNQNISKEGSIVSMMSGVKDPSPVTESILTSLSQATGVFKIVSSSNESTVEELTSPFASQTIITTGTVKNEKFPNNNIDVTTLNPDNNDLSKSDNSLTTVNAPPNAVTTTKAATEPSQIKTTTSVGISTMPRPDNISISKNEGLTVENDQGNISSSDKSTETSEIRTAGILKDKLLVDKTDGTSTSKSTMQGEIEITTVTLISTSSKDELSMNKTGNPGDGSIEKLSLAPNTTFSLSTTPSNTLSNDTNNLSSKQTSFDVNNGTAKIEKHALSTLTTRTSITPSSMQTFQENNATDDILLQNKNTTNEDSTENTESTVVDFTTNSIETGKIGRR